MKKIKLEIYVNGTLSWKFPPLEETKLRKIIGYDREGSISINYSKLIFNLAIGSSKLDTPLKLKETYRVSNIKKYGNLIKIYTRNLKV